MAKVNSLGWIKPDDSMVSNHWRLLLGYRPVTKPELPATLRPGESEAKAVAELLKRTTKPSISRAPRIAGPAARPPQLPTGIGQKRPGKQKSLANLLRGV